MTEEQVRAIVRDEVQKALVEGKLIINVKANDYFGKAYEGPPLAAGAQSRRR